MPRTDALRRLLDHDQVRRVAATRRHRAAATAAVGPAKQAGVVQQRPKHA